MNKVRIVRTGNGWLCPCGRDGLGTWVSQLGREDGNRRLQSHLPPGEHDPQSFCINSHEVVDDGDESPLLISEGTRNNDLNFVDVELWGIGGRNDPDVPLREYKAPRIPMGILGISHGSPQRLKG